jgi:hypothetical protein
MIDRSRQILAWTPRAVVEQLADERDAALAEVRRLQADLTEAHAEIARLQAAANGEG